MDETFGRGGSKGLSEIEKMTDNLAQDMGFAIGRGLNGFGMGSNIGGPGHHGGLIVSNKIEDIFSNMS